MTHLYMASVMLLGHLLGINPAQTKVIDTKPSLIKSYSILYGKRVFKEQRAYDDQGRLIKRSSINYQLQTDGKKRILNNGRPTLYKYYSDSIKVTVNNTWIKIVLNDQALATKEISPNGFSKTKALTTRLRYTYNKEGFLIKKVVFDDYITYSYTTTHEYEYKNGNMVKSTMTDTQKGSDGKSTNNVSVVGYEYYEDKTNTIGNINLGQKHMGKSSKNLVKRAYNLKSKHSTSYKYTFDEKGRVVKKTSFNDRNGKKTQEYQYEYAD